MRPAQVVEVFKCWCLSCKSQDICQDSMRRLGSSWGFKIPAHEQPGSTGSNLFGFL